LQGEKRKKGEKMIVGNPKLEGGATE